MEFNKTITFWYSNSKRDLPWRNTKNPYHIWLSEIILQQTQVKQGLSYYEAFVKTFPTVYDLANASEETVLKLWQGLGYYSRARNLHFSAKYIVNELNGFFPNTYKEIIKLKGVGDYTASAIASFAFNEVAAVVDGNVYRVLSRYFGISTPINSTKGIKEFKTLASSLIDHKNPGLFNQAIMEFGAIQCKPKKPDCTSCPLNMSCIALEKDRINQLPVKLKKTKITHKYFNFLVIMSNDGKIILEKRESKGIWQNLNQFPLIESERSLDAHEFNELNLKDSPLNNIEFKFALYNDNDIIHKLSHQHLHTKFWIITTEESLKNAISISEIENYPVPILIGKFIEEFNFSN